MDEVRRSLATIYAQFYGERYGAIFIAIVFGQNPIKQGIGVLFLAFVALFILGVVYTWIMLLAWGREKPLSRN